MYKDLNKDYQNRQGNKWHQGTLTSSTHSRDNKGKGEEGHKGEGKGHKGKGFFKCIRGCWGTLF